MNILKILFQLLLVLFIINICSAQTEVINVWEGKIPGAIENPDITEGTITTEWGAERIVNVTNPTLTIYKAENPNGAAVLICPGGGYVRLASDKEGDSVAVWLNSLGVTAFVLKYRLPLDAIMENKSTGPLQDAQEALRVIRRNAEGWGVNQNKVGVMGFSAGGHLASTISTHYDEKVYDADNISARPDFSILVYPVISMKEEITHKGSRNSLIGEQPSEELTEHFSNELQVSENTPPTFLVHAEDDGSVPVENSIRYFLKLKEHKVEAEMHIYQKGGHGFGLAKDKKNETEANWPKDCENWLMMRGIIK